MFASIIAKIGLTLLTEKVVKEVLVHTAYYFAKKSDNRLDDNYVKTVADALGVRVE